MTFQPHPERTATIHEARSRLAALATSNKEADYFRDILFCYEDGDRERFILETLDAFEALMGIGGDSKRALTDAVNASYNRQPALQQQPRTDEDAAWDAEIDAATADPAGSCKSPDSAGFHCDCDLADGCIDPYCDGCNDKPTPDPVNHPQHYTSHPSGVEAIQVTEHFTFCVGNAIKYLWRAGQKGDAVQDMEKAAWYINREIARLKAQQR